MDAAQLERLTMPSLAAARVLLLAASRICLPSGRTARRHDRVGRRLRRGRLGRLCLAISLLYTAGMFLNDAFDREFDTRVRPDRPIPSGDVTAREAFAIGWVLLAAGCCSLLAPGNAAPRVGDSARGRDRAVQLASQAATRSARSSWACAADSSTASRPRLPPR